MKHTDCIILGLDPGYGRCGWSILFPTSPPLYGCVETNKDHVMHERLFVIATAIRSIMQIHKPTHVAIEELFFTKNVKTALPVAESRGVLQLLAAEHHLPVLEIKPAHVKLSLTGYGRASKQQVQMMTQRLCHILDPIRPDDAADALAIALTAQQLLKDPRR